MTTTTKLRRPDELTERQWQARVLNFARWHGWLAFHPYDSRKSAPGYPDLTMVRSGRMVLAEVEVGDRPCHTGSSPLACRAVCSPGVGVYVWRPADWQTVQAVLA